MNTNELAQSGQSIPTVYQSHWPAIVIATGWLTSTLHLVWPRFIACGGVRGICSLIMTGKPISPQNLDAAAETHAGLSAGLRPADAPAKPASTDAQPKKETP